jgi:ABC-type glycerol-3-phosphate transport system substrate-binding protein
MRKEFKGLIITVLACLLFLGQSCLGGERLKSPTPVTLEYWRISGRSDDLAEIIQGFQNKFPHIQINVRILDEKNYEQALLEAWAEDRGPDIFSIPNTWLGKYQTKILPMPSLIELTRKYFKPVKIFGRTIKEDEIIKKERITGLSFFDLKRSYVDVVSADVYRDGQIFGLPLSLDTLVLYFNRDLLNAAKIVEPAKTWQDFLSQIKTLTIFDQNGEFIQSGAGLGTAYNVENAVDILFLLMLQNGTKIFDEQGRIAFNQPLKEDPAYFPGESALTFYTDFANPEKETYTWHSKMPSDFQAFIQNKVAYFFGYSYHLPLIKSLAPQLNFDLAPVPQIATSLREVNFARYFIEVVAKKSRHPKEAWAFLLYASQAENIKPYLIKTRQPTAHRSLVAAQMADQEIAPLVAQVLTAQSWYRGKSWPVAEKAIRDMINDVNENRRTVKESINYYLQIINQTL